MILVGAAALCWSIWHCRNDIYFNGTKYTLFLQALFRGSYWLRYWVLLQPQDARGHFHSVSAALEVAALELFASNGWKFNNRLTLA